MTLYKFATRWFGFLLVKQDNATALALGQERAKITPLLWLTPENVLLSGPGIHLRVGIWVLRAGIFTSMEKW